MAQPQASRCTWANRTWLPMTASTSFRFAGRGFRNERRRIKANSIRSQISLRGSTRILLRVDRLKKYELRFQSWYELGKQSLRRLELCLAAKNQIFGQTGLTRPTWRDP